jgi:hypothetical protein
MRTLSALGLVVVAAWGTWACGDDDPVPTPGNTGGTAGSAGKGSAGKGGRAGSGTGGGAGESGDGAGGSSVGGTGGGDAGAGAESGSGATGGGGTGATGGTSAGGEGGDAQPGSGGSTGGTSGSAGEAGAGGEGGDVPIGGNGPGECSAYVSTAARTLITAGAENGWAARNRDNGMLMFGCSGASSPEECLSAYPLASDVVSGGDWAVVPGAQWRVLFDTSYDTAYWTATSPEGRFLAHGGSSSSTLDASVVDLERDLAVPAAALYVPGFFPDGSGFLFAGTGGGTSVCEQSVLDGAPTSLQFTETACVAANLALAARLAASIDIGDYWTVTGVFSLDDGHQLVDSEITFAQNKNVQLSRFLNAGSSFELRSQNTVQVPYVGNPVLSPSGRLLLGQVGNSSHDALGYVLHQVDITDLGSGAFDVALPEVARYCFSGEMASFSYDERFIVMQHHASDEDAVDLGFSSAAVPAFDAYRGTANLYLIDLTTGVRTRITQMPAGTNALYPNFRSDGWIYFVVKDGTAPEYMVATDAALVLGAE